MNDDKVRLVVKERIRVTKYGHGKVPGKDKPDEVVENEVTIRGKDAEVYLGLDTRTAKEYLNRKVIEKQQEDERNGSIERR